MRLTDATREALNTLVDREQHITGSREVAYGNVARAIGASGSWVRKFCASDAGVSEPRLTLFEQIRHCYIQMCVRIEMEHDNEMRRIELLKGELNATDFRSRKTHRRLHTAAHY